MILGLTQSLRDSHPIRNGGSVHDFNASRMTTAYPLPSYRHPQPTNTAHMGRSSSKNMKIHIYSAAGPNPNTEQQQPQIQKTALKNIRTYYVHTTRNKQPSIVYRLQTLAIEWLVTAGPPGPHWPKRYCLFAILCVLYVRYIRTVAIA